MGFFFHGRTTPSLPRSIVLKALKGDHEAMTTVAESISETPSRRLDPYRILIAVVLLTALLWGALDTAHDDNLAQVHQALLDAFQLLFGLLAGLLAGESSSR